MKLRQMPVEMRWLLFAMIIANLASNMYFPLLPLYLESLGATIEQVGLFFTVLTIMSIVFRVLGGWISDHLGRVQTIAVGGALGMVAILGYTIAPTWAWAMLGALFSEMGSGLVGPSFQAYTAENAPEGATGSTFGLVNGLFLTCQIIGPLLGGFLVESGDYRLMMWTASAIYALAVVIRLMMARGKPFTVAALNTAGLRRDVRLVVAALFSVGLLLWLFVVDGILDTSVQLAIPFLPKFVTEIGEQGEVFYGAMFALMSVVAALGMVFGGRFSDRYSERVSIAVGAGTFALSWSLMLLLPSVPGFVLAFSLAGVAQAFFGPALSSLLSKAVPRGAMGITFGIFYSALGVMAVPAPYIGGLLYDNLAPAAPFWVAVVMSLLVIPFALWKLRLPAPVAGASAEAAETPPAAPATSEVG